MKKSILLVLFLGAMAALGGCVHPYDLDAIAPSVRPAPGS